MSNKLKKIFKGIFNKYNFEKVILFGSRARNEAKNDSDYDFLVVTYNTLTRNQKMKLFSSLQDKLVDKGIDADIIIKSDEEIDYYRDKIGSVVRNALKEGIALW